MEKLITIEDRKFNGKPGTLFVTVDAFTVDDSICAHDLSGRLATFPDTSLDFNFLSAVFVFIESGDFEEITEKQAEDIEEYLHDHVYEVLAND